MLYIPTATYILYLLDRAISSNSVKHNKLNPAFATIASYVLAFTATIAFAISLTYFNIGCIIFICIFILFTGLSILLDRCDATNNSSHVKAKTDLSILYLLVYVEWTIAMAHTLCF